MARLIDADELLERLKAYPKTLDAIREELVTAVGLVDRLKELTDCKTCELVKEGEP